MYVRFWQFAAVECGDGKHVGNVGRFTRIGVESVSCVRKGCCKKGKHGQDYGMPLEGSRPVVWWKRVIPRGVGVVMPYSLPPSRVRYMSRLRGLTEEVQS